MKFSDLHPGSYIMIRTPLLLAVLSLFGPALNAQTNASLRAPERRDNLTWVTNPPPVVPTRLSPVDTSSPDHIVGDGTVGGLSQAALQTAINTGGVIVFDTGGIPATLPLGSQLYVPPFKRVVIDGGGLVTLDGGNATRLLEKGFLSALTVQNLSFANAQTEEDGAAISVENWDGTLTIIDCSFDNCHTTNAGPDLGGGAVRALGQKHFQVSGSSFTNCSGSNGGALNSLGSQLTVIASSFNACRAFGTGGGSEQGAIGQGGIGGAIYVDGVHQNSNESKLVIDGCTFQVNAANDHGGALFAFTYPGTRSAVKVNASSFERSEVQDAMATVGSGGAFYTQNADLTLTSSTFEDNVAMLNGGALWVLSGQTTRIANCTFYRNLAGSLGGAIDANGGSAYLTGLTLAENHANLFGAGIRVVPIHDVWLKNSILVDNTAGDRFNGHNVSHTLNDGGGNLQWPVKRSVGTLDDVPATASVVFADPQLGFPMDNGGPTVTLAPLAGSPAIDLGTDVSCAARDQRGFGRNGTCDTGAVER